MDSKRKSNGSTGAGEFYDDRAAKRRKFPDIDLADGESPESTSQYGLDFMDHIRKTQDKQKRLVATSFLSLPSKRDLPDYYKIVKMPLALDIIEEKLRRRELPTLTTLESLFKRMIANAKDYNEKGSEIYEDAERLRKALSNFMTRYNPAYKTPGYVAFPTPFPQDDTEDAMTSDQDAEGEPEEEIMQPEEIVPGRRKSGRGAKEESNEGKSSSTPITDAQYVEMSFKGLSFQQAQEKLVADLLKHRESEDDEFVAFEPFITLPPRSLKDYYQVIKRPLSLKSLQKLVKGMHGRNGTTGITEFKSWDALADEASIIWKNAWHYNEDGSEISELASQLKDYFHQRLKEAQRYVQEPSQPKIKLKVQPSENTKKTIKLRIGQEGKASPVPETPAETPVEVPAPSDKSITEPVRNGTSQRRNPFASGSQQQVTTPLDHARTHSLSASVSSPTPPSAGLVKNEDSVRISPAVAAGTSQPANPRPAPASQVVANNMAPPASGTPNHTTPVSYFPNSAGITQPQGSYPFPQEINASSKSRWRQPGKDVSDALITSLSLATHPGLNIARHFRMDLPASATMSQQSITITLPPTHYFIQIKPRVADAVLERQYKMFVTAGTQRLQPVPTIPGHAVDARHPLFETRLLPGVNRIELEMVAAAAAAASSPPRTGGARPPGAGSDVEVEKFTVFANLMRS